MRFVLAAFMVDTIRISVPISVDIETEVSAKCLIWVFVRDRSFKLES